MSALEQLRAKRAEILAVASRHGARKVRVFGSVARGDDDGASDVDILVEMEPRERLRDILEAIERIERYASRGREAFGSDELIQTWFVRHLAPLGEAARALPEEVRGLAPEVPWSRIVGMRHVLVHDYFGIDLDLVWDAVERDVPALRREVGSLLGKLESEREEEGRHGRLRRELAPHLLPTARPSAARPTSAIRDARAV